MPTFNPFEPRTMLRAVQQRKEPKKFFRDRFFKDRPVSQTENIDVDFKRGQRRMAPVVSIHSSGRIIERIGYKRNTITPPLMLPKKVITWEDAIKTLPGENIYEGKSPEERVAALLGQDILELDDMSVRREEWMCAQSLITGAISIPDEESALADPSNPKNVFEIDFGLEHTSTNQSTTVWDNYELVTGSTDQWKSNPLTDIKAWGLAVKQATGITPDTLVLSDDLVDIFLNHPAVVAKSRILEIRLLSVAPEIKASDDGAAFIGTYLVPGLGDVNVYSYPEWYIDDVTGTEMPMLPANTALLLSTKSDFRLAYGAYYDVALMQMAPVSRYPRQWIDMDGNRRFFQLVSRPLPAPVDLGSWYVGHPLGE